MNQSFKNALYLIKLDLQKYMPICHTPINDVSLASVTRFGGEKALVCENPGSYCPSECNCRSRKRGFIGDCSRRGLGPGVNDLLTKSNSPIAHLKLDSNEIRTLGSGFNGQQRLRSIDLSYWEVKTSLRHVFAWRNYRF